jgi:hypothetical protein
MSCITRRSQSTDECFNCPIASGCGWCSAYNYELYGTPNKRATYICGMHKARSLANVYYWRRMGVDFPMHCPKDWAVNIIGEEEFEVMDKSDDNIYLLDYRYVLNSNVQIYNSKMFCDKEDMYNILAVLLEYNQEYPNDRWNRTIDGMYLEWYMHNVFYNWSILKERSSNVDLDTRDALFFEDSIVKKLLLK